jgi:hypothetical protein
MGASEFAILLPKPYERKQLFARKQADRIRLPALDMPQVG